MFLTSCTGATEIQSCRRGMCRLPRCQRVYLPMLPLHMCSRGSKALRTSVSTNINKQCFVREHALEMGPHWPVIEHSRCGVPSKPSRHVPNAVFPAAVDDHEACAPSSGIEGHTIWLQSGDGVFHWPASEQLRVVVPV